MKPTIDLRECISTPQVWAGTDASDRKIGIDLEVPDIGAVRIIVSEEQGKDLAFQIDSLLQDRDIARKPSPDPVDASGVF